MVFLKCEITQKNVSMNQNITIFKLLLKFNGFKIKLIGLPDIVHEFLAQPMILIKGLKMVF